MPDVPRIHRLPTAIRRAFAAAAAALSLFVAMDARGDAVPPPPSHCPPGQVPITSHRGPECVLAAPKNCPVGWRGIQGGTCMLTPCGSDEGCQAGEQCVEQSLCLVPFEDEFYDYNEGPVGASSLRGPLFAGPPPIPRKRPKPIIRYDAVNVCSPDVACAAPGTCQAEKICVPRGRHAAPNRGGNARPARVARTSEVPSAPTDADAGGSTSGAVDAGEGSFDAAAGPAPSASAVPNVPAAAPDRGGCAACASGGGSNGTPLPILAGIGALAVAALVVARQRGKNKRP